MKRIRVTAVAAVLVASGATAAASTTAAGGLSLAPAFLEHEAQPGPVGQIRVANGSAKALAVTVRAVRGSRSAVARCGPTGAGRSRRCG